VGCGIMPGVTAFARDDLLKSAETESLDKGISHGESAQGATVLHILGEDQLTAGAVRGRPEHCVPEGKIVALLCGNGIGEVFREGMDDIKENCILQNELPRRIKRRGALSADRVIQFAQTLQDQNGAMIVGRGDDLAGDTVFLAAIRIDRIKKDIGVQRVPFSAHASRRAWGASRPWRFPFASVR
jgi:hypothetical protein